MSVVRRRVGERRTLAIGTLLRQYTAQSVAGDDLSHQTRICRQIPATRSARLIASWNDARARATYGRGVPQANAKTIAWLARSADQGVMPAKELLRAVTIEASKANAQK